MLRTTLCSTIQWDTRNLGVFLCWRTETINPVDEGVGARSQPTCLITHINVKSKPGENIDFDSLQ